MQNLRFIKRLWFNCLQKERVPFPYFHGWFIEGGSGLFWGFFCRMQDDWIKCFTWQRNSTYSSWNKTTSALWTYRFFHPHAEQDREFHLQQESSLDSHWESALCLAFLGAANFSPSCFDNKIVVWLSSLSVPATITFWTKHFTPLLLPKI